MTRVIEVIYENGVFKPLEKIDLPQGSRVKMKIEEERGILTPDFIKELDKRIKALPKTRIDLETLDEIYYEGKMLH